MSTFWKSALERAAKTGLQVYVAAVMLATGLTNSDFEQPHADAFEQLFTATALKAAAVAAFLSLVSSAISRFAGPDDSASLVVKES